jgi:hypothetical protein
VETALVMLIVAGCTGHAAWTLMPRSARRRLAQLASRLPWARLQKLLRSSANPAGACGGCDGCAPASPKDAARPVRIHRR